MVAQLRFGCHHEQRRWNPLAGDVRQEEADFRRAFNLEEIVEVAADFLGRLHRAVDVELVDVGEGGELGGDCVLLDGLGRREVLGVLLLHLLDRVLEGAHRGVDSRRERLEFDRVLVVHAHAQISVSDLLER